MEAGYKKSFAILNRIDSSRNIMLKLQIRRNPMHDSASKGADVTANWHTASATSCFSL
jgi:hypothetical protein